MAFLSGVQIVHLHMRRLPGNPDEPPMPSTTSFWERSGQSNLFRTVIGWFSVCVHALPAVLPSVSTNALPITQTGPFYVDWIADRNLTPLKALLQQGIPQEVMQHVAHSRPVSFATENGVYASNEVLKSFGSSFGNSTSYVVEDCPIVRSLGLSYGSPENSRVSFSLRIASSASLQA